MMRSLCVRERFFLIKLAHPWALVCPHSFCTCNVIYTGRLLDKIPLNWGNYDLVDNSLICLGAQRMTLILAVIEGETKVAITGRKIDQDFFYSAYAGIDEINCGT
jgi:hypothetical protein